MKRPVLAPLSFAIILSLGSLAQAQEMPDSTDKEVKTLDALGRKRCTARPGR